MNTATAILVCFMYVFLAACGVYAFVFEGRYALEISLFGGTAILTAIVLYGIFSGAEEEFENEFRHARSGA